RLLADAAGWQVLKHARALREAGRVSSPAYKPPLLIGLVREGDREYRAGLKIETPTLIENLCSCRIARESGTICAHSVAVGLALLRPVDPPASGTTIEAPAQPPTEQATGEKFELHEDSSPPNTLHLVLPPNFTETWKKGSLSVGIEMAQHGVQKLL